MDKKILKEVIKRYWKIALLATIIIFLFVPFDIIINKSAIADAKSEYIQLANQQDGFQWGEFADAYLNSVVQSKIYSSLNAVVLLIFPMLLSLQLFRTIRNKEMVNLKENILVQAILLVIPYIVNAIILIFINFFAGFGDALTFVEILKWLGINILLSIFIYSISNFIGCFARTRATHMLSIYGLLYIPVFIIFTIEKLLQAIVYGFVGFSTTVTNIIAEWPGLKVFSLFAYNYNENAYLSSFGLLHIICYLTIIVLLTFGVYKILNKNKKYNVISMITIYSVMFILTSLFITSITMMTTNIVLNIIISLLISGIIYVILVAFLKEKNIKKLAIGYAIYSIIIIATILITSNNIFGFEKRIPNIDDIEYAVFSTNNPLEATQNIVYKGKDNIQYIIDRQKDIIEKQNTLKEYNKTYYKYYIQYSLKNGGKITRAYDLIPEYEEIYDTEEFISQRYMYILNEEYNSKLTDMIVIGSYNGKVFEINLNKDNELFTEFVKAISTDIKTNKVYRAVGDEYGSYGEKQGIQYITVDVAIDTAKNEDYLMYVIINDKYELMKLIQKYINDESDIIVWEQE